MPTDQNYLKINRQTWNEKVELHLKSEFYDNSGFLRGKSSLNDIEIALFGDISGKSILHLQCHFGQDTISLSRMGAYATGVDFSDEAVNYAKSLAKELHLDTKFVLSDVYNLKNQLTGQFDFVFTSYGVIGWLPDLDKWAEIINHFLKPGGSFIMAEFHPVIWMFDNDFEKVTYNYFKDGQIIETEKGSYADRYDSSEFTTITWNHSLSEVISSLIEHGMIITNMQEFDYSPYNCFKHTTEISPGKYVISKFGTNIPMVFAIKTVKKETTGFE